MELIKNSARWKCYSEEQKMSSIENPVFKQIDSGGLSLIVSKHSLSRLPDSSYVSDKS